MPRSRLEWWPGAFPGLDRSVGNRGLGFFLVCIAQVLQTRRHAGACILKRVFLAPVDDGRRTYTLHDPVINGPVRASVKQDIGDVIAD